MRIFLRRSASAADVGTTRSEKTKSAHAGQDGEEEDRGHGAEERDPVREERGRLGRADDAGDRDQRRRRERERERRRRGSGRASPGSIRGSRERGGPDLGDVVGDLHVLDEDVEDEDRRRGRGRRAGGTAWRRTGRRATTGRRPPANGRGAASRRRSRGRSRPGGGGGADDEAERRASLPATLEERPVAADPPEGPGPEDRRGGGSGATWRGGRDRSLDRPRLARRQEDVVAEDDRDRDGEARGPSSAPVHDAERQPDEAEDEAGRREGRTSCGSPPR